MLVLIAIGGLVAPIKEFNEFQNVMLVQGQEIIEQLPELKFDEGKLSINEPCPYYISDPRDNSRLIAIDTTGQYKVPSELEVPALVTADAVLIRSDRGDMQMKFSGLNKIHVTAKQLMSYLHVACYVIPVVAYLVTLPFTWLWFIAVAFAFSLSGLILAKAIGVNIKYEAILRVASFALGNMILLDAFLQIFPVDVPGYGPMEIFIPNWFFFKYVLAFGFTLFGVGANLSPPSFQSVADSPELDGLPPQR
jgi:hypothetical protein